MAGWPERLGVLKKSHISSLRATEGSAVISCYMLRNESRLPRSPAATSQ